MSIWPVNSFLNSSLASLSISFGRNKLHRSIVAFTQTVGRSLSTNFQMNFLHYSMLATLRQLQPILSAMRRLKCSTKKSKISSIIHWWHYSRLGKFSASPHALLQHELLLHNRHDAFRVAFRQKNQDCHHFQILKFKGYTMVSQLPPNDINC